ncbi:flavin reductase family protein [Kitasatospora xanthocidica]|uniref:flavin reductase family protein n=1 Tax=Kitasatospora xanthocidica TaxID=83382 RepID=UPI0016725717|nr:flavin reductase family protein [Kitasatospora xanthocidica]GHF69532.1 hypothetical protein GCM10018790_54220 [Kitasatospora xanthocidica]
MNTDTGSAHTDERVLRIDYDDSGAHVEDSVFRSIMATLPTGVSVITTLDEEGRPKGLTCSAVCSVSARPPLLLACLDNRSTVLTAILARGGFVVNVLRERGEGVSNLFASRSGDRFGATPWRPSPATGLPWIERHAIAHADCRLAGAVRAGDHTVLVGAVVDGTAHQGLSTPLMYWRSQYGTWPAQPDEASAAITLAAEG